MIPRSLLMPVFLLFLGAQAAGQGESQPLDPQDAAALALAREIEAKVSEVRALEVKQPTRIGAYSEDELRTYLRKKVDESMTAEIVDGRLRAMVLLGLYARETDLIEVTMALLGEQVAGFYEPEEKQLFVVKRGDGAEDAAGIDRVIMAHELVHALQDQHFDLKTFLEGLEENDDELSARRALVEGDATWAMLAFQQGLGMARMSIPMMPDDLGSFLVLIEKAKKMGLGGMMDDGMFSMDALQETPAIDADALIFAYYGGAKFCLHLMKNKDGSKEPDFDRLNAAFARPPRSTEQVLHPQKYDTDLDEPTRLELPDLGPILGPGWTRIAENTLGELGLRTLVRERGFDPARAKRAHSGWDGDRYAVWAKPGEADVLVWASAWDSNKDELEFAAVAIEGVLSDSESQPGLWRREGQARIWNRDLYGLSSALKVSEDRGVFLIHQAPADRRDALLDTLQNETKWAEVGSPNEDR